MGEETRSLKKWHNKVNAQKVCFFLLEQIFQNIKQEYSRYQRWRQLEVVLNQSEACTSESQPHSTALTAPSSPGKRVLMWTDHLRVCKWEKKNGKCYFK